MLTARKPSVWRNRYDVALDGQPVTTFDGSFWKGGGTFTLDGREYEVRGSLWGNRSTMVDEMGGVLAAADRVGRKRWTVTSAGQTYEFHRASLWGNRQDLYSGDRAVGSVNRPSNWRSDVELDLPGVPAPVQIFVLAVVVAMWDAQAAAAS